MRVKITCSCSGFDELLDDYWKPILKIFDFDEKESTINLTKVEDIFRLCLFTKENLFIRKVGDKDFVMEICDILK